jgi:two-component system, OmpR family, response regulator
MGPVEASSSEADIRILLVEDDDDIAGRLAAGLRPEGFVVDRARNGEDGYEMGAHDQFDATILDLGLPNMQGLAVLRKWRAEKRDMPVLILTAHGTWTEKVEGLNAGADDYITKPFTRDELLARVHSVLRRAAAAQGGVPEVREFRGLALDVRSLRVTAGQKTVTLGPIEFRLLNLFMSQPERAMTRSQIVDRVWRNNAYVDERTVDVHIRRLRFALEPTGHDRHIQTVRGVGYRFAAEPLAADVTLDPDIASTGKATFAGMKPATGAETS